MAGKIIVIEGLDGSGKATQTELLYKKMLNMGKPVKKLTFPVYESEGSAPVRMYLNGEFGDNPDDVNPYTASTFYGVDRVISYLKDWKKDYEEGAILLCDRYSTSNPIYQLGKLPESQYDEYLNWLSDFEHKKLGIPAPDYVIYLDMPIEVSQKLMSKRYSGDESKKDIHEKNQEFLKRCRNSAMYCSKKLNWEVVSCAENSEPKAPEVIAEEIYSLLKGKL